MATADLATRPSTRGMDTNLRNYVLVTGAYWADTLTDGAIRMLVLFYFYRLGYSPVAIASLFIFYEVFGVVTNLIGGYLASRFGLKATLFAGLITQIVALGMLGVVGPAVLTVPYVMVAQALSGIAKDLTKMSAKSAVKLIVPENAPSTLYKWVAILTGSKNAVKGLGFFVGGLLLTVIGFRAALVVLALLVTTALISTASLMRGDLGTANKKAKFRQIFSENRAVNMLAAARLFLFGSRDVWFVVGLPVFLYTVVGWDFWLVGGVLAAWTIGYGVVQAAAPRLIGRQVGGTGSVPDGRTATRLAFVLALFPMGIALALRANLNPAGVLVAGLIVFGITFALNSAVHSYLVLAYTNGDKVAMNVGFYYMANAGGRLTGTVLSGVLYQTSGLIGCLWVSAAFVLAAGLISRALPAGVPLAGPVAFGDGGD